MYTLATYASNPLNTKGRVHLETPDNIRNAFHHDRDRIIHSTAFRRLKHKTQVFINPNSDLFRTRLTHSLEVAQLSRSLARALNLHEDLAAAIALAHDLGHTPFGHIGQKELNRLLNQQDPSLGGFEHNLQSLRIVDHLEERYPAFSGLNLTFETRAGLLKHCSLHNAEQLGDIAQRFIDKTNPSLEAQLVNVSDELAYVHHDIDDGLRSGLLTVEQICDAVPLFQQKYESLSKEYPNANKHTLITDSLRQMLLYFASDLIRQTKQNIQLSGVALLDDVFHADWLVEYSPPARKTHQDIKNFLMKSLYRHNTIMKTSDWAAGILRDLFTIYHNNPTELPKDYQHIYQPETPQLRLIADYISGMTDRFAINEHQRLTR